jgi:hypothetical protein
MLSMDWKDIKKLSGTGIKGSSQMKQNMTLDAQWS